MISFAALETVDTRKAWAHEALDFTPWLAANLDRLSDAVGIRLELEGTEVAVDRFSADVLARNAFDGTGTLIEPAASDNVIIATPTTLIALLKAVAYGWRQEKIADGVRKFTELGKEFYARLANVYCYINGLGKTIDRTVREYNKLVGSVERRLTPTAKRFHDSSLVLDNESTLEEPGEADRSTRSLDGLPSVEDEKVLNEDLDGLVDDFEDEFGRLRIAREAGGSGD